MKLSGKHILVTGGATGIGLALAKEFLNCGCKVTICGRSRGSLALAKQSSPDLGVIQCDLSTQEGLHLISDHLKDDLHDVSILVNNAAVGDAYSILRDPNAPLLLEQELSTNLIAPIKLSQMFLPSFESQPEAAIINLTSGFALCPNAAVPGYSVAKVGLRAFSKVLRQQLQNSSIKVVEVLPPMVDTRLVERTNVRKMSPEKVAGTTIKKLQQGVQEIYIGDVKLMKWCQRLSPRLMEWVLLRYPFKVLSLDSLYEASDPPR